MRMTSLSRCHMSKTSPQPAEHGFGAEAQRLTHHLGKDDSRVTDKQPHELQPATRVGTRPGRWHTLWRHSPALILYIVITVGFTAPIVLHFTDRIAGNTDALENYWNHWWAYYALVVLHQNPMAGRWMNYPFTAPLYFHTFQPFNVVLGLPIQALWGTAAAYNALTLLFFIIAALGMYILVWS